MLGRDDLSRLASSGEARRPIVENHVVYARHQPQFEAAFEALRPISAALNA